MNVVTSQASTRVIAVCHGEVTGHARTHAILVDGIVPFAVRLQRTFIVRAANVGRSCEGEGMVIAVPKQYPASRVEKLCSGNVLFNCSSYGKHEPTIARGF